MNRNPKIKFSNDYYQLELPKEQNNNVSSKKFLKSFNHQKTILNIPTKLKNVENNIFSYTTKYNINNNIFTNNSNKNNNYINNNTNYNLNNNTTTNSNLNNNNNIICLNDINNTNNNKKKKKIPYRRYSSLVNYRKAPVNNNILSLFQKTLTIKSNNDDILPSINTLESNIQNEASFQMHNNSKEIFKSKFHDRKVRNNIINFNTPRMELSGKKIKIMDETNMKNKTYHNSKRKFIKMKTLLNKHIENDLFLNKNNTKREKSEKNGGQKEKEENLEDQKKEKKEETEKQELLYSRKIENYIFKIYKEVNKRNEKGALYNYKSNNNNNNKNITSPKISIEYYLNHINPKKYVNKIKEKLKNEEKGNPDISKNKIIFKTYEYIEDFISLNNKRKPDIFECIKKKNKHCIEKSEGELVSNIINEILLKVNFKHKHTIFKYFIDNLIISQSIKFHIHIQLNIMRHVLTRSEKDENIFFINLIKHLLYSEKKKYTIRYPYMKCFREAIFPFIKRTSTVDKFLELSKKKKYYLYFCLIFQQLDCETILNSYNIKKTAYSKKKIDFNLSSLEECQGESMLKNPNFSTKKNNRLAISQRSKTSNRKKAKKGTKNYSKNLINFNLSKSIISLRNKNIQEALKDKSSFNLKKIKLKKELQKLYEFRRRSLKHNTNINQSENANENEVNDSKKLNNANKSSEFNSINTIEEFNSNNEGDIEKKEKDKKDEQNDENDDIHEKDRELIFEHFFSCVEYSEYDKLYNWLKDYSKFMDLNYKLDNGDTLLHLCVRYSVPHYIYEFLISHGININSQNNDGDTALHLAVKYQKYKTIDLLIKMGASENIYNKMQKNCWECL